MTCCKTSRRSIAQCYWTQVMFIQCGTSPLSVLHSCTLPTWWTYSHAIQIWHARYTFIQWLTINSGNFDWLVSDIPEKLGHHHSTRFTKSVIHLSWYKGRKEGNVLFSKTLNTFYLWLYGVRHMVKDHSDSERGNPLPPHGLLFPISSKGSFICTISQTG